MIDVAVQLPVLELAFFPRELQGELVGLDARTAVGSVITGLVTFRESLVWDRIAGDAQDKVSRYYVYRDRRHARQIDSTCSSWAALLDW